ncbi:DUF192 domain-containing protein [Flavobacteriaceae bacterium]|nr:DUF192 domain-containing protein [Flavobacteriaceae bacterium]MDB2327779.1 DUF192 domain-containing protein [Flavobacteriaceae bacterium]
MKHSFLISLFTLLALSIIQCNDNLKSKTIIEKKIVFQKEGELVLINTQDEIIANFDIEIAETPYEQQTGLMYRNSLSQKNGMLFIFESSEIRSFYMKNTQIPLDLIFINDQFEIVSIYPNAKPYDQSAITSKIAAQYILEINAGQSEQLKLKKGMKIKFNRI